ncbi:hypothetical protein [Tenggerimyces flavus]|uniref:Tissue inhibitor of metalloproteinase n=1 Tax=Tenggerimyces flavus TaxID=1708749 RepID=A0ABV7YP32_9ACTN|nr:hypothetical protein [Tenggerimyces flavus]MBM7786399.1 hypothetical protein [Tenggerimyces flavus]
MVKQLIRFIAAMAIAGGALLTVSGTACACSCVPNPNLAERVAKADVVFSGTAISTKEKGEQNKVITFQVGTTYKGKPAVRNEILTARDSASCGLEIQDKTEYLVFANKSDHGLGLKPAEGQYTAILCGGADPFTKAGHDELVKVKGVKQVQVINEKPPVQPAKVVKTQETTNEVATEKEAISAPIWPWAGGAVLLLAAAGGLVWWRRSRA